MLGEKMIKYYDAVSPIFHYAINADYMRHFEEYCNAMINQFEELKGKGRLKRYVRPRKKHNSDAKE